MTIQQIFEILDKEYQEYVNTVNSHPDSYDKTATIDLQANIRFIR